jgi:hypothetical protein
MNQQTKQLLEAAGFEYIQHDNIGWAGNYNASLPKLVELVVRECMEIVEPTSHHKAFAQSYMGGVDGLDLLYSKVKQIKQHFGVTDE